MSALADVRRRADCRASKSGSGLKQAIQSRMAYHAVCDVAGVRQLQATFLGLTITHGKFPVDSERRPDTQTPLRVSYPSEAPFRGSSPRTQTQTSSCLACDPEGQVWLLCFTFHVDQPALSTDTFGITVESSLSCSVSDGNIFFKTPIMEGKHQVNKCEDNGSV